MLKKKLRRLWLSIKAKFTHKKRLEQKKRNQVEDAKKYLEVINDFKGRKLNEPFTIIAVRFVSEVNYLMEELTKSGYTCVQVAVSMDIPRGNSEKCADFYIGTIGRIYGGWRNNARGAAMFCFSQLNWDYFLQMEARLVNGRTFYANGKYHHINGIKQQ